MWDVLGDLLYSTEDYSQYFIITHKGKESKKGCVCVSIYLSIYLYLYLYISHFIVCMKLTQHCIWTKLPVKTKIMALHTMHE